MKKFAFIGAGSMGFTRHIVRDLLTYPAFEDCEIRLMDIDPLRLEWIAKCVNRIVEAFGNKAKVVCTLSREEALRLLREKLTSGEGLEKLRAMIASQGGDARVVDDLSLMPQAQRMTDVLAEESGYIASMETSLIGYAAQALGAGRIRKEDDIESVAWDFVMRVPMEKAEGWQDIELPAPVQAKYVRFVLVDNHNCETTPETAKGWTETSEIKIYP